MRVYSIILFVFLFLSTPLYAEEQPSCYYIQDGSNTIEQAVGGKTYKFSKNQTDFITTHDSFLTTVFPGKILVKIYEKSKFSVHNPTIESDFTKLPSILKLTKSNYTFSLMNGIIDILNDEENYMNNVCAIHTPRINLLLKNGMFRIIVQDKTTVVVVYKGSLYALNIMDERKHEIIENTMAVINTYIPIDGNAYFLDKATITTTDITNDDKSKMEDSYKMLTNVNNSVSFAIVNGEVIGIKTK